MKKGDGVSKESRLRSWDTNQVRWLEGLHKKLATPRGRQEIFRTQLTHESPARCEIKPRMFLSHDSAITRASARGLTVNLSKVSAYTGRAVREDRFNPGSPLHLCVEIKASPGGANGP
ncbi:unnamed protein product [Boreogadus saida]